jgi:predicted amidohydrolase YtcJ
LRATALFSSAQLIEMGSQGARLAFATRKLGRLEAGYEASFLLLYADPTKNWLASLDSLVGVRGGVAVYDKARMLPATCSEMTR